MKLVSCHEFSTYKQADIILACWILMVSKYLLKLFVIFEQKNNKIKNIPIEVNNKVLAIKNIRMILF